MKIPFSISKTYSTELSKENILQFVCNQLNRKNKVFFFSIPEFTGSIQGSTFKLRRNRGSRYNSYAPKVRGELLKENPTLIKLTILPNYFMIAFFVFSPIAFTRIAINMDTMIVNEVERAATFSDRLLVAALGGVVPLAMCFFLCIWPVWKTENWIKEKLKLVESTLGY